MCFKVLVLVLVPVVFAQEINFRSHWDGPGSRNGKYVNVTDYPYVVSIRLAKSGRVICTGIIITLTWVLSVPYCFMLTPDHFQEEWDSKVTLPPLIEIIANKQKPLSRVSYKMNGVHLDTDDKLGWSKLGPNYFNETLQTSTTDSPLSEDQIKTSVVLLDPEVFDVLAATSTVSDCASGGQLRLVTEIVIHPKLKLPLRKQRNPRHELALLKVDMPFVNENLVMYAPLLRSFTLGNYPSKNCQLVGWGRGKTIKPLPHLKTTLSEITVRLYDSRSCRYIENTYLRAIWDDDPEPWFCSYDIKYHSTPICQSDSGGPLVCGGKVVALLSWVRSPICYYRSTEFVHFRPVYYSRTYLDLDWIAQVLGGSKSRMVVYEEDVNKGDSGHLKASHTAVLLTAVLFIFK